MYPVLFEIDLWGVRVPIYGYGFMIMLGAFAAYFYIVHHARKELDVQSTTVQGLARVIIIAAFVGGKLLYYLEDPGFYFVPPSNMLHNFRTGFVFYGSLIFAIPAVVWYLRKQAVPLLPMLDIIAIGAVMLHILGRSGCLLAGCCYGLPTEGPFYLEFTDPLSKAPLHEHLHPTQLYSITLLSIILVILVMFKRHQRFKGQLFLVYVGLYAIGRSIIEVFRGDEARGFIIEPYLSHSQLISLVLVGIIAWFYAKLSQSGALK